MNKYPKRKAIRLKEYDYTQPGYYYVTICTYDRKCLFGDMIDDQINLNIAGQTIDQILKILPGYYSNTIIDNHVVMPNHVHAIIQITNPVGDDLRVVPDQNQDQKPNQIINKNILTDDKYIQGNGRIQRSAPTGCLSLSNIIQRFKMITTKKYIDGVKNNNWQPFNKHLWQRNYYDHLIRTTTSLKNIREYIINNPATWDNDEDNPNNKNHNQSLQQTVTRARLTSATCPIY
jgi:putative transposase